MSRYQTAVIVTSDNQVRTIAFGFPFVLMEGTHVVWAGLELAVIPLPQPPECHVGYGSPTMLSSKDFFFFKY